MPKPKNNEVIEKIAKETDGVIVFSQEGRLVVKLQSNKVILWLDYRPARTLPYTIDASFCGLRSHQAYPTMKKQIRIAKSINKICDDLITSFCAIIDRSLR
jgi:hypothetical protein